MQTVLPQFLMNRRFSQPLDGMRASCFARRIEIPRRSIFKFSANAGQVIHCDDGAIWITKSEDAADVILEAGQSFSISGKAELIIEALKISKISIEPLN